MTETGKQRRSWMVDTRPLRVVPYRRLWIGNGVAFFGFQFTAVAVPVEMFDITRSSAWVGLLGVAGLVPLLIFGLWGGAIADVVDRRRLLLISSLLAWLSTGGLLAQALADALKPLGTIAHSFDQIDYMVQAIVQAAQPGDHILVMSNGGFGGVHQKLIEALAT